MKAGVIVNYRHQPVTQDVDKAGDPVGKPRLGEPETVRAQVTHIYEDEEIDLAVLNNGTLVCGVTKPKLAATTADRAKPGHWWT